METDVKDLSSFIKKYEADERSGVIKLVETARKRINSYNEELRRIYDLKQYEREYESYEFICGIDEVGREN